MIVPARGGFGQEPEQVIYAVVANQEFRELIEGLIKFKRVIAEKRNGIIHAAMGIDKFGQRRRGVCVILEGQPGYDADRLVDPVHLAN